MSASGITPRYTRASSRAASQRSNPVEASDDGTSVASDTKSDYSVVNSVTSHAYGSRNLPQYAGLDAEGDAGNLAQQLAPTIHETIGRQGRQAVTVSTSRMRETDSAVNRRTRTTKTTSRRASTINEETETEPVLQQQRTPNPATPGNVTATFNTEASGFVHGGQSSGHVRLPSARDGQGDIVVVQNQEEPATLTRWKRFKQYLLRIWEDIPTAWPIFAVIFAMIVGMLVWHHLKISSIIPIDTTIIERRVEQFDARIMTMESRVERLDAQFESMQTKFHEATVNNALVNPIVPLKYRAVNFFSTGLGAVTDPYLTSPTMNPPSTWKQDLANRVFLLGRPNPNPPVTALEDWEDIGNCWCTAHSKYGEAQLAVVMPRTIYPTYITVEHIPATATLDISAAPRAMELWVQLYDKDARVQISKWLPPVEQDYEDPTVSTALDETFIRVATWTYDIFAPSHVQTFPVNVDMQSFDAGVRRVVIRAKSNHGSSDYTCFYRVKMHGELVY